MTSTSFGATKTVTVNGTTLAYREQGEGEPVVFVHGGISDLRTWEQQLPTVGGIRAKKPRSGALVHESGHSRSSDISVIFVREQPRRTLAFQGRSSGSRYCSQPPPRLSAIPDAAHEVLG
jgi:pimeloyl-ACP methyl ester carboxylesterase